MFNDTVSSSIEWKTRYAQNKEGEPYPFDLFKRKVEKLHPLAPLELMSILFVSNYEREIYETKNLTPEKVISIAHKASKKYVGYDTPTLLALNVPHIYGFESSASYHGYGLAELAVHQWREYFFKKYGYIVDNEHVGKEMTRVWQLGATKTFGEFVKIATGKVLSADAFIRSVTKTLPEVLKTAEERVTRMSNVPLSTKPVQLNAKIIMVHGKEKIADNKKSFEDMAETYKKWLNEKVISRN